MRVAKGCHAIVLAIAALVVAGQAAPAADPPPYNAVLIGWDGAQREHVKEMLARHQLPNLAALAAEGTLVDIDITTGATDTKAGWAQIVTGYTPAKTGVESNMDYRPIPEGYTIFERLEEHFGPRNIVTVALLGKRHHVGTCRARRLSYAAWAASELKRGAQVPDDPTVGMRVRGGGLILRDDKGLEVAFNAEPYYGTQHRMDLFRNGLGPGNERVGVPALAALEQYRKRRFFCFFLFEEPDRSGHHYGENSREYTKALIDDDRWTGRIIAKLKELGIYHRTFVYVTADHGFDEGMHWHHHAPTVFLATNDPNVHRNGDRADIAPTILKRFGVDLTTITPPLDGAPLDRLPPARSTVSWLWEQGGFFNRAYNPTVGDPLKTQFRFRVKYTATDGAPPTKAQCLLERLEGTQWVPDQALDLTRESGTDQTGAVYTCLTRLPNDVFRHRFDFEVAGRAVTGDPLGYQGGPIVRGVPRLWWTGQPGFEQDGMQPNRGAAGTRFAFRVLYADSEGDTPRIHQVEIRRNGQVCAKGNMSAFPAKDYRIGEVFRSSVVLTEAGAYEYRFRFVDDDGYATGEPGKWLAGPTVTQGAAVSAITSLTGLPAGPGAQITLTLSASARVEARVLNLAGHPIRLLCRDRELGAGPQLLLWDGTGDNGLAVPAGRYLVEVTSGSEDGGQARAVAPLVLTR